MYILYSEEKLGERERVIYDMICTMVLCFAVLRWLVWVWALFLHCWDLPEVFRGRVLTTPRRHHTGGQLGQEHHVSLPETNVSLYFMLVKQQGGGGGGGEGCPSFFWQCAPFFRTSHFTFCCSFLIEGDVKCLHVILIQGSITKL